MKRTLQVVISMLLGIALVVSGVPVWASELDEPSVQPEEEVQEPEVLEEPSVEDEVVALDGENIEESLEDVASPEALIGGGTVTVGGSTLRNAYASYPVEGVIYFAANLSLGRLASRV